MKRKLLSVHFRSGNPEEIFLGTRCETGGRRCRCSGWRRGREENFRGSVLKKKLTFLEKQIVSVFLSWKINEWGSDFRRLNQMIETIFCNFDPKIKFRSSNLLIF